MAHKLSCLENYIYITNLIQLHHKIKVSAIKTKYLNHGRYVNVIRECILCPMVHTRLVDIITSYVLKQKLQDEIKKHVVINCIVIEVHAVFDFNHVESV